MPGAVDKKQGSSAQTIPCRFNTALPDQASGVVIKHPDLTLSCVLPVLFNDKRKCMDAPPLWRRNMITATALASLLSVALRVLHVYMQLWFRRFVDS
jgi:hypothetical protein